LCFYLRRPGRSELASICLFFYDSAPCQHLGLAYSSALRRRGRESVPPRMSLLRIKEAVPIVGCALLAAMGCTSPWTAPSLKNESAEQTTNLPADSSAVAAHDAQAPGVGSEPELNGVLDKLQQVRAIDPSAEQKLTDELRRTPAESWPLVAEQFRASLAYREQLAAKNGSNQEGDAPTPRSLPKTAEPRALETGYDSAKVSPSQPRLFPLDQRPSAPIGALVDPRHADADGLSSEALAKAMPYSTPVAFAQPFRTADSAPNEFTTTGPSYPIVPAGATSQHNETAVVQTRLETVGDRIEERIEAQPRINEPTAAEGQDADWQASVEKAAGDLSKRVSVSPTTTAEVHQHVSLRMLWLLAGDTEKALEPIPHIPPGEQDYWSRQLFALATYLDHHSQPDDKRRAAASVRHLNDAASSLRELASLTVRNLSFCKNVYGFGAIEPFETDVFSPGQEVSLYVEVENFHSQSTEKGFCTSLGSTYEIVTEKGDRISGRSFPDVDDTCRTRRRDFHIQYGLALPETIAPGRYKLQLVVKDRQCDKIGHATAGFEIRGSRP
jgi:hypothetical protein